MAFQSKDLSVIAYANGFTLWHYATEDLDTVVDGSGYFDEATDMLRKGDILIANTDTDGTFKTGLLAVVSNLNGVVDVSDLTALSTTNTD